MSQEKIPFQKSKTIFISKKKWTKIDSLSIIPNSIFLNVHDSLISNSSFEIDFINSLIKIKNDEIQITDSLQIELIYQTFDFKINQKFKRKDSTLIQQKMSDPQQFFRIPENKPINSWNFTDSELSKNGSISRGISVGNKQNVLVNSDLNLQLSGKLSDQFQIAAAITDRNIPLQPDGNTQQLQDFDKVYINIYNTKTSIIAGDFEIQNSNNHFLRFNKKVLGGLFEHKFLLKDSSTFFIKSAISVSKGKYRRQEITPIDLNQGPYKLMGENNEPYIMVIAGSEKVYIDGILQTRGELNDYTIDYNIGEIIFTPRQILTKEKRIVVEFEYSDKHYSRTFIYNEANWKTNKTNSYLSFYSETDIKNQSIQPVLDDSQKNFLSLIGDDMVNAWYPNFDSVAFSSNEIRYKLIDTTFNSVIYDSVFVYSTNPDSAFYRLGFVNVGKNSGNYILDNSLSNGRVYKWVAPLNNIPQGDFEPIVKLVPPIKKQMLNIGTTISAGKYSAINSEIAISQNDKNTFSSKDQSDDIGIAFKINYSYNRKIGKTIDSLKQWKFGSIVNYELISSNFQPIEPFRDVEFERSFSIANIKNQANQHFGMLQLKFNNSRNEIKIGFKALNKAPYYKGIQTTWGAFTNQKNIRLNDAGFYSSTKGTNANSTFLKNDIHLLYNLKFFTPGIKWKFENNRLYNSKGDSLYANSLGFNEIEYFIQQNDTSKNMYKIYYLYRIDELPKANHLISHSKSNEYGLKLNLTSNQNHQLTTNISYRERNRIDTISSKKENSFASNFDYSGSIIDKSIRLNTFYEAATGLEQKKDFYFLKVNKGTGNYVWNDYNSNGIEELDEFEQTVFSDLGEYVKLWRLTNNYIQTYYSRFNQTVNLNAPSSWNNKSGVKGLISRLSNQFVFKSEKKLQNSPLIAYNPFIINAVDSDLVSSNISIRNSFAINQRSPVWSNEIIISKGNTKLFLTGGFEKRTSNNFNNVLRINFSKIITSKTDVGISKKNYSSDQFSSKNNHIIQHSVEQSISLVFSNNLRCIIVYKYIEKKNDKSPNYEKLYSTISSTEITYNINSKTNINWKQSFIKNIFNGQENSSLAFEMLEGLNKGLNYISTLALQTNLGQNLQLQSNYEIRISNTSKAIHIGNITLRAYF